MAEVVLLTCANCGGPLAPPKTGEATTCSYCGCQLLVQGQATAKKEPTVPGLTEQLLHGFGETVGEARRYGTAEMESRDWRCYEHGLWPVSARASSQFGLGWNAEALIGAPRVYPRCGDIRGAWAPGTRQSRTEWVEVDFPPGPPARAVRVFETSMPGATFALTLRDGGREERIWEGRPALTGREAMVLEVPLDPPRPVRTVRAYVSNELGSSWSEIDTIGLVATQPVPEELRRRPGRRPSKGGAVALGLVIVGLVVAAVVGLVGTSGSSDTRAGSASPAPATSLRRPAQTVAGGTMMTWAATVATMNAEPTRWASSVIGYSSQYGSRQNAATQALGPPDVYPSHRDSPRAWAPAVASGGQEWLTVRFDKPVSARSVILVETLHPGSLARIDDVSGEAPAILWEGSTSRLDEARVLSLELAAPREISKIRVVLDTTRRAGWSAIDAIGLVPQRKGGEGRKGKRSGK